MLKPFVLAIVGVAWVALSAATLAAQAPAQSPPPSELKRTILDLKYTVIDLKLGTQDTSGGALATAGKVEDLAIKETATEVRLELAADVLFDFDKAEIKPEARGALKKVAAILREKARGPVRIEGHTDAKGTETYNQRLSLRRADSVRNWLVQEEGLKNVTFATRGLGATKPIAPNTKPDGADDPQGRQKNRRVEIIAGKV